MEFGDIARLTRENQGKRTKISVGRIRRAFTVIRRVGGLRFATVITRGFCIFSAFALPEK